MGTYEALRQKVRDMAGMRTAGDRAVAKSEIIALIQALETERPAAPEALARAYEDGALRAMELAQDVRREHEESFKAARFSAAGIVLNGMENYGQAILSKAESAVSRHLNERRREKHS